MYNFGFAKPLSRLEHCKNYLLTQLENAQAIRPDDKEFHNMVIQDRLSFLLNSPYLQKRQRRTLELFALKIQNS